MKYFRAYRFPDSQDTILVRQGFHWRFIVLGPFGFLLSRHWTSFALSFLVLTLLLRFDETMLIPGLLFFNFAYAVFAGEILGWENGIKGASPAGFWLGSNRDEAMLRYTDKTRPVS